MGMDSTPGGGTRPGQEEKRPVSGGLGRWFVAGIGAALLGVLLLGGTALAQSDDSSGTSLGQTFIDRLAERLGLGSDELETAITDTKLEMIDEAVANGTLSEARAAELRERIESGEPFFGFGRGPGFGHGPWLGGRGVALETVAETLGMTEDELQAELRGGTDLADIIAAQGSTVDEVVDALVARAEIELGELVATGELTQEQADEILGTLPARLTERIENGFPNHWCFGPPGTGDEIPPVDEETFTLTIS